ncbi:MAG: hypothetical protein QCH35_02850 [Methanomicrobiaceae archaeon]|nr:hypothetical protein [Methanomicrobiaceae archaeon]
MSSFTYPQRYLSKINFPFICYKFNYFPLISSIAVVALSGALKLHFAYEFLGRTLPLHSFIVAILVTYASYAFDRGVGCSEDEERSGLFKSALLVSAVIATILSFVLFANILLAVPYIIGYLYARGIGGHRLKGGYGVKNAVVALTWASTMPIFLCDLSFAGLLVYLFFFSKSFVNTIIYDVRDAERDREAGIATIPTLMSKTRLRALLILISAATHCILIAAALGGMLACADILVLSALHSLGYIIIYSGACNVLRNTLVDGEWILYTLYSSFRAVFL